MYPTPWFDYRARRIVGCRLNRVDQYQATWNERGIVRIREQMISLLFNINYLIMESSNLQTGLPNILVTGLS